MTTAQQQEAPFLERQREEFIRTRPYEGISILHNLALSIETAHKVELLVLAGAKVTVSRHGMLRPQTEPEARARLEAQGIEVIERPIATRPYDFYLDCSGELASQPPPRVGCVEITQSGANIYKRSNLTVPVISVDDSPLKTIENFWGTGDGFLRAISLHCNPQHERFLLFGHGRVGRGIVHALEQVGAEVRTIDANPAVEATAHLHDSEQVEQLMSWATVIVTATGQEHFASTLDKKLFAGKLLANMGAEDEFGPAFSDDEVLYNKIPLNFSLPDPTRLRYLDPIFYAHNLGPQLIREYQLGPGVHPLPKTFATTTLAEWRAIWE